MEADNLGFADVLLDELVSSQSGLNVRLVAQELVREHILPHLEHHIVAYELLVAVSTGLLHVTSRICLPAVPDFRRIRDHKH